MRALVCITWLCCGIPAGLAAAESAQEPPHSEPASDDRPATRFAAFDVYVDARGGSLAAYQVDIRITAGRARIAGIEGGEHDAFRKAPFYDPKAIQRDRIILAAFSTAPPEQLPTGKTRVATLHAQLQGEVPPQLAAVLETTSVSGADPETVTVTISQRKAVEP